MFILHPQLQKDCTVIGELPLSTLLLMNDANYPWFVLVPRRAETREWFELAFEDQQALLRETNALAHYLQQHTGARKMNIGALGNMVPQLHVHVIGRFETDPAWPGPVWGKVPPLSYTPDLHRERVALGKAFLAGFQQQP